MPPVAPSDIDYIGHNKGRCMKWHTVYDVMSSVENPEFYLDESIICQMTDYLRCRGPYMQVKVTCRRGDEVVKPVKRKKAKPAAAVQALLQQCQL